MSVQQRRPFEFTNINVQVDSGGEISRANEGVSDREIGRATIGRWGSVKFRGRVGREGRETRCALEITDRI
jgi:hypothetical protein